MLPQALLQPGVRCSAGHRTYQLTADMYLPAGLCPRKTICREMSRRPEANIRSGPERLEEVDDVGLRLEDEARPRPPVHGGLGQRSGRNRSRLRTNATSGVSYALCRARGLAPSESRYDETGDARWRRRARGYCVYRRTP